MAFQAQDSGGVSLDQIASTLYEGKNYKDLKGANKAVVQKYLREMGPMGKKALEELERTGDTSAMSSTLGISREKASDMYQAARGDFEKTLNSAGGWSLFGGKKGGVSSETQDVLKGLDSGELIRLTNAKTDEEKGEVLRVLGQKHGVDGLSKAMKEIDSLGAADKTKLKESVDKMNKATAAIGQTVSAVQGEKGDTSAAVIGNISKDTQQAIVDMSKQLINNYKILLEYQKLLEGKMLQSKQ